IAFGNEMFMVSIFIPCKLISIAINWQGSHLSKLPEREREVLIHIAEWCSNKEIAQVLDVGVRTVETHRERSMRKLSTIAALTRFAVAKGLTTLREDIRR